MGACQRAFQFKHVNVITIPTQQPTHKTVIQPSKCQHFSAKKVMFHVVCFFVGSRPSDHYFRSVCWFVWLSVCLFVYAEFFSAVFDPISVKLGHMLYVWI